MLKEFIRAEAASGIAVVSALAAGLLWFNFAARSYLDVWQRSLALDIGPIDISLDAHGWVNNGLMTLFFFAVGLELKREFTRGELRDPKAAVLPMLCAAGGAIVPAAVFAVMLRGDDAARAWGVPTATDPALVLGVLALLGPRAPAGLKLFVLTLAITDDLIGVGLIALFYSHGLSLGYLAAALITIAMVVMAKRLVASIPVYVGIGFVLWYCTLRSGIEAPLAGAVLGMLTPATPVRGRDVLETLERRIVPLSAFVAVPLFALGNVDIDLSASAISDALGGSVTWAVIVASVGGKFVGIFVTALVVLRLGWGTSPAGVGRRQLAAGAALSGVGFAVAFFVAEAALADQPGALEQAKFGVLVAAISAASVGIAILTYSSPAERNAYKADP